VYEDLLVPVVLSSFPEPPDRFGAVALKLNRDDGELVKNWEYP
jgi:hypothetical protein